VVVFSSQDSSLWQVEQFAVPIRSRVHVGPKPFIMPLANVFDAYGAYAVALVDQQAIRMFYFHLGEVIATENREGEEIKRIKVSGGAAGRMRGGELSSHLGETVNRNLRQFAERLAAFCAYHKAEHILLGGAEPTLHQFKDMLSQPWRDRVEGMFSISVRASEAEVLEESLMAMRANLHTREARLVDTITTLAAKGANGVVGKEGTIAAVDAGRVQTLVLVEDVLPPEEADAAITRVVDYGGRVVFVDPDSPLVGTGGIGALLRY
jgi:stalled ribosome rescue protein Dom34